jgi:hypothetical protein
MPTMDPTASERAERFVRRYGEAWQAWDLNGFVELFVEGVTYVVHPDEIVEGRAALRRYFEKEAAAQGNVAVRMGMPLIDGNRVMTEFWVTADDASIAGCLIAHLDEAGACTRFREYWFDLEGSRSPFDGWGS